MDRRGILKGLGSMIGWSRGFQSRLFRQQSDSNLDSFADGAVATSESSEAEAPAQTTSDQARDIRKLTQHFTGETDDISPWMFIPEDNIRNLSTSEHPGFVTIWHGDKGKDIKGILKKPIRIDDHPIPWEFHLGLAQYETTTNLGGNGVLALLRNADQFQRLKGDLDLVRNGH